MALIELREANVWLGQHHVLKRISCQIEAGQHFMVMGSNGSGKSTFLKLLAGVIWPRPHDSRVYEFGGQRTWSPLRARENIALLSPEIQERFVRQLQDGPDNEKGWQLNAREAVLAGFFQSELLYQTPTQEQEAHADATIAELGLANLAERPLQTLSQGQMRRVLMARALVASPQLLLLDEACSGLDAASRDEMLELIDSIARSGRTTVGMTTHRDAEEIPSLATVFLFVKGGFHQGRIKNHDVKSSVQPLRLDDELPKSDETLLRLEGASVFLDGAPILRDLNWELKRGHHIAVEGGNGAGKTTFMRLLRGELHPAAGGKIIRFGQERMTRADIGARVSFLSPAVQAKYSDRISVETAVASGFFDSFGVRGQLTPTQSAQVHEIIEECSLADLAARDFTQLSYGQRRRTLLARALVTDPQILLLDEALDGLDRLARTEWNFILAKAAQRGATLVVTSHHREDYPPFLGEVLTLENGRILAQRPLSP